MDVLQVWITTVKSAPESGDATERMSNAKSSPSFSTGVGQMASRTLAGQMVPRHNCIKSLVVGIDGEHRHVFLIRASEIDVDESPDLQSEAVRAVRCRRDRLRRSGPSDVLRQHDAVVGIRWAARGR